MFTDENLQREGRFGLGLFFKICTIFSQLERNDWIVKIHKERAGSGRKRLLVWIILKESVGWKKFVKRKIGELYFVMDELAKTVAKVCLGRMLRSKICRHIGRVIYI